MRVNTTNGYEIEIDEIDLPLFQKYNWSLMRSTRKSYVRSVNRFLHRMIVNADKDDGVEFVNGNTLDLRRENLRHKRRLDKWYPTQKEDGKIIAACGAIILIDPDDFDRLIGFKWHVSNFGYAVAAVGRVTVSMHRIVMGTQENGEIFIDHINHNKLDNRKLNLRTASRYENSVYRQKSKSSKGKFKGVSRSGNYWLAKISYNYKNIYIGKFESEDEAAAAYDFFAYMLHGEFAYTNEHILCKE